MSLITLFALCISRLNRRTIINLKLVFMKMSLTLSVRIIGIVDFVVQPQRLVPVPLTSSPDREILRFTRPPSLYPPLILLSLGDLPFRYRIFSKVCLRLLREPKCIHCQIHDPTVQILPRRLEEHHLAPRHNEQPRQRRGRAERCDRVLEPSQRHPHQERHEHAREERDREREQHGGAPDAEAGDEAVHELVLCDLVPGVPDRPRTLERAHSDESSGEYGEPEYEARKGEREEEERPREADEEAVGDYGAGERAADAVVFDAVVSDLVLVCLNMPLVLRTSR